MFHDSDPSFFGKDTLIEGNIDIRIVLDLHQLINLSMIKNKWNLDNLVLVGMIN